MDVPFGPVILAAIQAFAGDAGNFLNRTVEWPWYGFWGQAFYGVFDPSKVIAGPQYEIAKRVYTNDAGLKVKKKFPDFVLHYLSGVPLNHDIDDLRDITNHEQLLQFSRGRFALTASFLLAICEIKAIPDPQRIPAGKTFQSTLQKSVASRQFEATYGAQCQAGLYLSANKNIHSVVAIAAFGPHFSWKVFTRDTVTDVSSNEDPTFVPHDSADSDSGSEPVTMELDRETRVVHAPSATSPAAGSVNERPKRMPRPVNKYVVRQNQEAVILGSQSSESEKGSTAVCETVGKANAAKAGRTTTRQGLSLAKGKAANRTGPSRPKKANVPAGKKKGKAKERAQSKPTDQILTLPPFLQLSAEHREEALENKDQVAGSSATTDTGHSDAHAPALDIPDDELRWSEWHNWASLDAVPVRAKMLNAIQRQYPNFPCLLGN